MPRFTLLLALLLTATLSASAQDPDPQRFKDEVNTLVAKDASIEDTRNLIVFAGSSSIRMWKSLEQDFPSHNVINRGFGGSHMSDLLYYADELILKHRPTHVFIYEGDNDIAAGKSPRAIMADTRKLIARLRGVQPEIKIVLIAAKPSISRWKLHEQYQALNKEYKALADSDPNIEFADVWTAMLDGNGKLQQDLFLEDDLHMNAKGYDIWQRVVGAHLPRH